MKVPLGAPQRPGLTAGDKNTSDPARLDERLRVLAAALTSVRRGALMTTTVGAALVTAGTVAVVRAEFSAHSHAPVILGTHPWFICGEDGNTNMFVSTFRGFNRKSTAVSHRKQEGRRGLRSRTRSIYVVRDSLHQTHSPSVMGQLAGVEGSDLVWDGLTQEKTSASTYLFKMKMVLVVETNIPLPPCWTLAANMGLQGRRAASVRSSTQSLSMSNFSVLKECASVRINCGRRAD